MDITELKGETLAGRFELEELLGIGGYGAVFRAVQLSVDRPCAVKVLSPGFVNDDNTVERFRIEARTTSRLNHPNTVVLYDFGQDEELSVLFLAMELLEGESLRDVVRDEGTFEVEEAVDVVSQAAGSLQEAHDAGTVHRDVKPHNIMLVERGGEERFVKVIDFGIAKAVREGMDLKTSLTRTGMMVGTPAYMAPEQVRDHEMDGRTDQYALAMTTYHMLTGSTPFQGGSSMEIASRQLRENPSPVSEYATGRNVPPAFDEVLLRALSKSKEERFDTVEAFAEALEQAADSGATAETIPPVAVESVDSEDSAEASDSAEPPALPGASGSDEVDPYSDTAAADLEGETTDDMFDPVQPTEAGAEAGDEEEAETVEPTAEADPSVDAETVGIDGETEGTLAVPRSEWGGETEPETATEEAATQREKRETDGATAEVPAKPTDHGSSDESPAEPVPVAEPEEPSSEEDSRHGLVWAAFASGVVLVAVVGVVLVTGGPDGSGGDSSSAATGAAGLDARGAVAAVAGDDVGSVGRGVGDSATSADARATDAGRAEAGETGIVTAPDGDDVQGIDRAAAAKPKQQPTGGGEEESVTATDEGASDEETDQTEQDERDKSPGTIIVRLIPWGELYVDGRRIGRGGRVTAELSPGRHELVLKQDGKRKTRETIWLSAGERRSIELVAP